MGSINCFDQFWKITGKKNKFHAIDLSINQRGLMYISVVISLVLNFSTFLYERSTTSSPTSETLATIDKISYFSTFRSPAIMNSEKIQEDDTFSTVQHAEICSVESTSVNKPYHLKRSIKDRHIQVSNTLNGQNAEFNHTMI
jgi:hypothetical protein